MSDTKELPAPAMAAFATRETANAGHKIPLFTSEGVLTAHWLLVRGIDSEAFTIARNKQNRRIAELVQMKDDERELAILESTLEMQASLVAGWSFSDPELMGKGQAMECTHENVKAFLRTAPQIAEKVDEFASKRSFFFSERARNLLPLQPSSLT